MKLTTSFRSVPEIQACVNAAFAPVMTGDAVTLQANYVPLSPDRAELEGQPAVVALPVPEPYGVRNLSAVEIEQSLPDAVGAFIDWVVNESGWKVTGRRGSAPEQVQARDICILFRRFLSFGEDITQPYVRALEARGVPHVLVGGKTFHDREEVETLRAALSAIEWPDDELSVFAALRGALFAIGDEELLEWKHGFACRSIRSTGGRASKDSPPRRCRATRPSSARSSSCSELHRRRNYRPVAETIQELLDATRAHVGIVLRSGGEQALANVLHVAELAREYEAGGGLSFRGFVDELRDAAEDAQAAGSADPRGGQRRRPADDRAQGEGARVPDRHPGRPDLQAVARRSGALARSRTAVCALKIGGWSPIDLLLHDPEEAARDQAEAARLTYVAATRARDVLVVPVVGDGPYDGGWLDPLMPAIYPPDASRRAPHRAPGCPAFKSKDSVLDRPDGDPARPTTVAPGRHSSHSGPGDVLGDLVGSARPRARRGLVVRPARDDLIVKDGDMFAVEDRLADYERWKADRAATLAGASRPTLRVETATAWARDRQSEQGFEDEDIAVSAIETVEIDRAKARPAGPRFGSLVHATLATVPLDADAGSIARVATTQARILGATDDERHAALQAVGDVLAHPLLRRARDCARSGRCYREMPVTWLAPDGTLIEGTIDLAFEDADELVVLDFKTDRELTTDFDQYRRQVDVYCRAIGAVKGKTARGILLRV